MKLLLTRVTEAHDPIGLGVALRLPDGTEVQLTDEEPQALLDPECFAAPNVTLPELATAGGSSVKPDAGPGRHPPLQAYAGAGGSSVLPGAGG